MQITIEIPDNIAQRLDSIEGNLSHRFLEFIVAEALLNKGMNQAGTGTSQNFR
jgi:hypothetical protein